MILFRKNLKVFEELPLNVFFMSPRYVLLDNMAFCNDGEREGISEEIELLRAIYIHELEVHGPEERPSMLNLFLHPSTGDDSHDRKYVCLNLCVSVPNKYPFVSPEISIKNPRGLSDAHVTSIQENIRALAKEKIGSPMLYDLIEYAKDCLSDNNIPSCPCVICLEHFAEEKFVKTECYHYFHAVCLGNYVDHFLSENMNEKVVCPMCRLEILYKKSKFESEDESGAVEETFVYKPDKEQLKAQSERQSIFEYQKRKGGIIDIEEERNKYLIGIKDSQEELSETNDYQTEKIVLSVVCKEPSSKVGLLQEPLSQDSGWAGKPSSGSDHQVDDCEQRDQRKMQSSRKNNPRQDVGRNLCWKMHEPCSEDQMKGKQSQAQVRHRQSRRRDDEGEKRTHGTESGEKGITKDQALAGQSNVGKNPKNSQENQRRNLDVGRPSKAKSYSRALEEGAKHGEHVSRVGRNSPSQVDEQGGNSRNSKEQQRDSRGPERDSRGPERDSRGPVREDSTEARKSEAGESRNVDRECEMISKKQGENNECVSPQEGDAKNGGSSPTERTKERTSTSSTQRGNTLRESEQTRENKDDDSSKKATSNTPGSARKRTVQTDGKQNPRNMRTRTPRRRHKDGTDGKISQKDKEALNKNVKDSPRKEKISANVPERIVENKKEIEYRSCSETRRDGTGKNRLSIHGPPPGFESVRSERNAPRNVQQVSARQLSESDPSSGRENRPRIRQPPPGFENVKPMNKNRGNLCD